MIELPEEFDSIFRYIVVVSQRAEQIINGAKPRIDSRHSKPTLEALDDVDAGLVEWRILSQAELDAQRQAIVEQFRAEVAGEGFPPDQAQAVPDVLPTSTEGSEVKPASKVEPEERDDELARLQRLLGMVGEAAEPKEPTPEDVEAAAEEVEKLSLDLEESGDDVAESETKDKD